jgi:oligopeptide transport system ATP-binding protein
LSSPEERLLEVKDLVVEFPFRGGSFRAVDGLSLSLDRGETLAILGESGSGKSMTGLAIMRLVPGNGRIRNGSVRFLGDDVFGMEDKELRDLRGRRIAMVFQDPLSSLNPVFTVGSQIGEMFRVHRSGLSSRQIRERVVELLDQVKIPDARSRLNDYPHQLSGGMRQRATIAMALALDPDVLIADEPTTALDVTVQGQILDLLNELKERRGLGLMLITHDFGVVAAAAQRMVVMYAGREIEAGEVASVTRNPAHPYTAGLMAAVPKLRHRARRLTPIPGVPARPYDLPSGCNFHPRCPVAQPTCAEVEPPIAAPAPGRISACHFADDVMAGKRSVARSSIPRGAASKERDGSAA